MTRHLCTLICFAVLLASAGCDSETGTKEQPVVPRPLLWVTVKPELDAQAEYSGTIQARYQTDRGFQTLGRIIWFDATVGDLVRKGSVLAQIDPTTLDLAVRGSEADMVKARADLANAQSAEARANTLFAKKITSEADFDSARNARQVAGAAVQQSAAALQKARENRRYASLIADTEGVIVGTFADVGQTAAAGQKVLTIAQLDAREAVIDIPNALARGLKTGAAYQVVWQANLAITATGTVREIAPEADTATRTRRIRIALDHPVEAFRLGSTITARGAAASGGLPISIPLSALLERDGRTWVWRVDSGAKTVNAVEVTILSKDETRAVVSKGVVAGDKIAVAAVHTLTEGQQIRFDEISVP